MNEGRMRIQEAVSARPTTQAEGRLRNAEVIHAVERTAASSASAAASEARQRLQEGTKMTPTSTAAVKIPSRAAVTTTVGSVPNTGTTRNIGGATGLSSSLSRPATSGDLRKMKQEAFKKPQKTDEEYDEAKNPFADEADSTNPFGDDEEGDEYNESLNPFAE